MGTTRSGIFSLPLADKYLTSKGTLRKQRGKPRIDIGVEFVIYAKIQQIRNSRKLSEWKAWLQLTEHRNFPALMKKHFQNKSKFKNKSAWRDLIKDPDWKKNFYKNNIVRSRLTKRLKEIDFTF